MNRKCLTVQLRERMNNSGRGPQKSKRRMSGGGRLCELLYNER